MSRPWRVLIVSPNWVGDAVMAQVLVKGIRSQHSSYQIDVLAPRSCHDVWYRMGGIASVLDATFPKGSLSLPLRYKLAANLRGRYDQAIVLPNSLKSALIPWLAGIPLRTGYIGEWRWGLLNDVRRLDKQRYPRWVDRCYALSLPSDTHSSEQIAVPAPELLPNSEFQHSVLQRLGLLDAAKQVLPVAILCPGAEFGSAKQWPWHHWQSMAERLVKQGYSVWFMGTAKERDGAEAIAHILPEVKVLCGQTALGEAIDLMALASVVVANDSGLLHIAAALGRSVIGLYGSTPSEYAPPMERWQGQAHVFELTLACRPCRQRECPLGHRACLENILPERVEEKILSMK